jgi:serine protease DegQ
MTATANIAATNVPSPTKESVMKQLLLAAVALVVAVAPRLHVDAQPVRPVAAESSQRPSLAPLLKRVTPAVVNIAVTSAAQSRESAPTLDPFLRRFFDFPAQPSQAMPRQSVGSGVIVDAAKGYVLTNHHVVEDAQDISVTLTDGRTTKAELVGSDQGTDVALLKVNAKDLTAIELANSDQLQVGDYVVAIGDPFGLGQTVTSGIVSALGRSGLDVEGYEDFIQTDASINPGNSGGALVDLDGKLVGINTAILAPAGGNVGIGFAVPSNMANQTMHQLIDYGEVRRGRLGVAVQSLTPDLAEALSLDAKEGVVVNGVEPASPAEKAGIKKGDVIVGFRGEPIKSAQDLRNRIGLTAVGTNAPLTVLRDGKRRDLTASIDSMPTAKAASGSAPPAASAPAPIDALQGADFRDVPRDAERGNVKGALVARIEPGSPADRAGLQPGDVVTGVNRTPVASAAELAKALRQEQGRIALNVQRGDKQTYMLVR